jgi:hypothetical protein
MNTEENSKKSFETSSSENLSLDEIRGQFCPLCGQKLIQEKCKMVCRSAVCGYRIIFNCSEF